MRKLEMNGNHFKIAGTDDYVTCPLCHRECSVTCAFYSHEKNVQEKNLAICNYGYNDGVVVGEILPENQCNG